MDNASTVPGRLGLAANLKLLALLALVLPALPDAALAVEPPPSRREMAEQLGQQSALIKSLRTEIEQMQQAAPTVEAIEESRQAVERQQRQVDQLLERVKAADNGEKAKADARMGELQQQVDALVASSDADRKEAGSSVGKLQWSGYGAVNYQRYDFFENAQDRTPERRARTDLERVVLAPRYHFGNGISFHGEIEFEHGGTGSTVEYEAEEAGEFEAEIEKGGEVVLEYAYLQIERSPALNWRVGEIIVPFGMVNTHHQPSEYFTIERSLAETNLIPSVWHETGVELYGAFGKTRYQLQAITALDSTGFNGYGFVRNGMQTAFEFRNATSLAYLARVDHSLLPGVLIGGSVYYGDSSKNRPRRNLASRANVTLAEIHGRWETGPVTVRGQMMMGRVQNADNVTQANFNTFNGAVLGVSRTPVGSRAESYFVEAGYNLFHLIDGYNGRLDVFARFDAYNTHASTAGSIVPVSRYDRNATTVGLNYKPQPGLVFKAEYSRRTHAGSVGNKADFAGVAIGFEF